jgi:hypothetical protein
MSRTEGDQAPRRERRAESDVDPEGCRPTKITGSDLKGDGNDVAIDELVLARESLEIVTP